LITTKVAKRAVYIDAFIHSFICLFIFSPRPYRAYGYFGSPFFGVSIDNATDDDCPAPCTQSLSCVKVSSALSIYAYSDRQAEISVELRVSEPYRTTIYLDSINFCSRIDESIPIIYKQL